MSRRRGGRATTADGGVVAGQHGAWAQVGRAQMARRLDAGRQGNDG